MSRQRSISFHTLGCKLNFAETSSIQKTFEKAGYMILPFGEGSDISVINTCSVTEFADRKCRSAIKKAKSNAPEGKVVMIGCYAQLKPKEISELEGVDMVLGAKEKFNLLEHISELDLVGASAIVKSGLIDEVNDFESSYSFGNRTRSFLKVQDGCNYKCSFCTIPLARGKSRSDSIENVVAKAQEVAALGAKEIVLTGVNTGDFVDESTGSKRYFIDLIRELDKIETISRFRISSIEPNLCSNEIIDFVKNSKRFVPHFHMPLQSGSDKMLKMMRRRYKKQLYADRVSYIKSIMPDCCIGVDVIVGFPGETDEDFMETYDFLRELDVSYFHVFTYSERANTVAPDLENSVAMHIRKERSKMLRILSEKKKHAFYSQHIGKTYPVILEKEKSESTLTGFTNNYIKIHTEKNNLIPNQEVKVKLNELLENGLVSAEVLI